MLAALEQNDPPLIVLVNRKGKELYESMKIFFDRNIGTYQSVIGYKIQSGVDEPDIAAMKTRINHILKTL